MLARMWWRGATWRPAGLRRDRRVMVLRFAGVGCTSTRQLGVDAPAQLLGAERFRDVVVRAELEASIDVGVLTARGEQDDPRGGGLRVETLDRIVEQAREASRPEAAIDA